MGAHDTHLGTNFRLDPYKFTHNPILYVGKVLVRVGLGSCLETWAPKLMCPTIFDDPCKILVLRGRFVVETLAFVTRTCVLASEGRHSPGL